jgi:hypothetical protein
VRGHPNKATRPWPNEHAEPSSAAWWLYEARRPEHLGPYPLHPQPGEPRWGTAHAQAFDSYDFEPILYLAANGRLFEDEIRVIRERGAEAAERVGTDREQRGTTYAISQDRSAVRLARAVDAALAGEPDDAPDYGVGRGRSSFERVGLP